MKALLLVIFAAFASAQFFPVSGVVVDATSGSAMRRVRVTLTSEKGVGSASVTGEDGKFSFQVPHGKYAFAAEYRGVRQPFGQSGPSTGFGVSLYTGAEYDTTNLVFRWFPSGVITGKVVDDRGEPAEQVLVQLIRRSVVSGRKRLASAGWFYTNDVGEFRFSLPGGTYYLLATGKPWYTSDSRPPPAVGPENGNLNATNEPSTAYAPAYYPNALDISEASALVLPPGAEVKADFILRTIHGVNVRVNLPDIPTGANAILSLLTDTIEGVQGFQRQAYMGSESQTVPGVPPGRYVVRVAAGGNNAFSTRKTIDVGASDVTVDLQMQPAPTVSGKVSPRNAESKLSFPLSVRLVSEQTSASYTQPVDANGSFSFKAAPVGRFRAVLVGGGGSFITEITVKGGPFEDGVIDIADGASIQLQIAASNEAGRVRGLVVNGDQRLAGMLLILAREGSNNPLEYRGFETDSDGSFDFATVPAGDYVLFAVDRLDFEYSNPEAVRPYLASGKRIHVGAKSVLNERIPVTSAPSQ